MQLTKNNQSGDVVKQIFIIIGMVMLLFMRMTFAANINVDADAAVGFWAAVDDKTNKVSSIIQIWRNPKDLTYYGKIYKIFGENGHKATDRCESCKGNEHAKPMLNMVIIQHMRFAKGMYIDGRILDPRDGSEYHARMKVTENGQLLKLRGYIGIPLFGRTAQWQRAPQKLIG